MLKGTAGGLTSAKSAALGPLNDRLEMVMEPVPLLPRVTDNGALVVLMIWLPNARPEDGA